MPRVVVDDGVSAPPSLLLWGVIGMFILIIVGIAGSVFVFRDGLRPSQQQRVIELAPFMRAFLPATPVGGALPTVEPNTASNNAALDLLNLPLAVTSSTPEAEATTAITEEVTAEATAEPTSVSMVVIEPTATPTLAPTNTPLPQPTLEPSATPQSVQALPTQAQAITINLPITERIFGLRHQQQTWNNCGPATITMALSYYGWQNDQAYAARTLKPNREDKNVSPEELVSFVNEQSQVKALMRYGGSTELLKALIANKFAVVVERGIRFEAYEWVGHYQALVSYDDTQGVFYAYDSFLGTGDGDLGVRMGYRELDDDWRAFNRLFMVVYLPQDEGLLMSLLGELADEESAATVAFNTAQTEATANPQDPFAWFNMGTSLTALGRYAEAANAFDQAFRYSVPYRILWYQFAPFVAYYEIGRYDDVLRWAQINLTNAPELEEMYYWRGRVYQAQDKPEQARSEYNRALAYNSNFQPARNAINTLG